MKMVYIARRILLHFTFNSFVNFICISLISKGNNLARDDKRKETNYKGIP